MFSANLYYDWRGISPSTLEDSLKSQATIYEAIERYSNMSYYWRLGDEELKAGSLVTTARVGLSLDTVVMTPKN